MIPRTRILQLSVLLRVAATKTYLSASTRTLVRRMSTAKDDRSKRLVWVDCEMTGLDPKRDVLLEVAVLVTDKDLNLVAEGPDVVIHQSREVLDSMGEWCTQHHGDSGLTAASEASTVDETNCEERILEFLREHVPEGRCPLAGNSVGQDAKFLSRYMPRLMEHLHYRVVDVSTVKELAKRWRPEVAKRAPSKKGAHRAMGDIKESVEELKYYRDNFFVLK